MCLDESEREYGGARAYILSVMTPTALPKHMIDD